MIFEAGECALGTREFTTGGAFDPPVTLNRDRWCMKKHHHKPSKSTPSKTSTKSLIRPSVKPDDPTLHDVATELDTLARRFLPDRVLRRALAGHEEDMRQDAILLALSWYLRHKLDPDSTQPWHAPRAIAAALQIQRRDLAKAIKRESNAMQALLDETDQIHIHRSFIRSSDLPVSTMQVMLHEAIKTALKKQHISFANAAVALEVMAGGTRVQDIAKRFRKHRSAIYQHLNRVRSVLPEILDTLEIPLDDMY